MGLLFDLHQNVTPPIIGVRYSFSMSDAPSLWQQAKAFVGPSFWKGLAKGALLGIPTAMVVWGVFNLMPTLMLSGPVLGFIDMHTQFLFCTVFGAAGAAVSGGMQAVADLNHKAGLAPDAPTLTALSAHEATRHRDPSPTITNERIKEILDRGPTTSHEQAQASRLTSTSHTLH